MFAGFPAVTVIEWMRALDRRRAGDKHGAGAVANLAGRSGGKAPAF
jgi:hypothetical protein